MRAYFSFNTVFSNKSFSIARKFFTVFAFILTIFLFSGVVSAAEINDTFHLNIQTTDGTGAIVTGTFAFQFNITENSNSTSCEGPIVYNHSASQATDSRGIVSIYLPQIGSGGGNLSQLSFDKQYYLCYTRDGSLESVTQLSRVPYSFRATQVNLSEITVDSNLDLNTSGQYNITANYGFFSNLGSLFNRISSIFVQDINASGDASIGGNVDVAGNVDVTGSIDSTGNITTQGNVTGDYGFFNSLGSLVSRITNIFATDADISNNLTVGQNVTIGANLNVSGVIYGNGSGLTDVNADTADSADTLDGFDSSFFMPLNTSVVGNFSFNGGWENGGLSLVDGDIYAQTGFFYNITSLNVSKQDLTINDDLLVFGNSDLRQNLTVDSGTLFVNSNTDRVGIGTASPTSVLELSHSDGSIPIQTFYKNDVTINNNDVLGRFVFDGLDSSRRTGAIIQAQGNQAWSTTTNEAPTDIHFFTQDNTASDALASPRLTINYLGNVGIGTTSPLGKLQLNSTSSHLVIHESDAAADNKNWVVDANGGDFRIFPANDAFNSFGTPFTIERSGATTGNVGIGTSSPQTTLHVNGSAVFNGTINTDGNRVTNIGNATSPQDAVAYSQLVAVNSSSNVTSSGSANYIPYFVSSTHLGSSQIYQNGSNIGIGTTGPGSKLHVSGGNILVDNGLGLFGYNTTGAQHALIIIGGNDNVIVGDTDLDDINFNVKDVSGAVNIKGTTGNVGIGTASPAGTLDVNATTPRIYLHNSNTGGASTDGTYLQVDSGSNFFRIVNQEADGIGFSTNNTERMRILAGGNVGIGTTSPNSILHINYLDNGVYSSLTTNDPRGLKIENVNDTANTFSDIMLRAGSADGHISYVNTGANQGDFYFTTDNSGTKVTPLVIQADGDVGIGTTSPGSLLELSSSAETTLTINNTDTSVTDTQITNAISFNTNDVSAGGTGETGFIRQISEASTGNKFGLAFGTSNNPGPATEYMRIDGEGNVGIGTTSPGYKLDITAGTGASTDGFVSFSPSGVGNNRRIHIGTGSGHGFIDVLTSATGTAEELSLNPTGGNVGIGTSSPNTKLEINHSGNLNETLRIGDASDVTSDTGIYLRTTGDAKISVGSSAKLHLGGELNDNGRLVIDESNGNVGIGTSSPGAKLDIRGETRIGGNSGSGLVENNQLIIGNTSQDSTLAIQSGTTDFGRIVFQDGTSGDDRIRGEIFYDHVSNYMALYTNASERLRIDTSGNVGIGTTSPGSLLHLEESYTESNDDALLWIRNTKTGNHSVLGFEAVADNGGAGNAGAIYFDAGASGTATDNLIAFNADHQTDTNYDVVIRGDGNVGIGTTSPGAKLHVVQDGSGADNDIGLTLQLNSASTDTLLNLTSPDAVIASGSYWIKAQDGATDVFSVRGDGQGYFAGNVGIGTTNPGANLDVNGTVSFGDVATGALVTFKGKTGTSNTYTFNNQDDGNPDFTTSASNDRYLNLSNTGTGTLGLLVEGNVGIGTTGPLDKLTIASPTGDHVRLDIVNLGSTAGDGLIRWSDGTSVSTPTAANMDWGLGVDRSANKLNVVYSTGGVTTAGGNELFTIQSDGNVGIGTTTPQNTLNVVGDANVTGTLYTGSLSYDDSLVGGARTEVVTATAVDDMNISLGRYLLGGDIIIQAFASGNCAGDGGVYMIGGSYAELPTVQFRSETLQCESSSRVKFWGKVDTTGDPAYAWLWAEWTGNANSHNVRFKISSANDFDTSNTGSISGATVLSEGISVIDPDNSNTSLVGIGTRTPVDLLTVGNAAGGDGSANGVATFYGQHTSTPGVLEINDNTAGGGETAVKWGANGRISGEASDFNIQGLNTDIVFYTGSTFLTNERMRIEPGGNVGIGTASPDSLLDIEGGDLYFSSNTRGIYMNNGTSIYRTFHSGADNYLYINANTGFTGVRVQTNGQNRLAIDNSGNVGIGTTSPQSLLHVTNASVDSSPALEIQNDALRYRLRIDGSDADKFKFTDVTNSVNPLIIEANTPSSTLYLDSTGKVGIGDTSPGAKLTIGGSNSGIDFSGGGNNDITTDGNIRISVDNDNNSAGDFIVYTGGIAGGNERLFIDSTNGNVGIGTTNPGAKLTVWDSTDVGPTGGGALRVGASTTNLIAIDDNEVQAILSGSSDSATLNLQTDGGTVFVGQSDSANSVFRSSGNTYLATNAGNVGVGTITPQNKLNVVGDINATGTIYQANNQVLDAGDEATIEGFIYDTDNSISDWTVTLASDNDVITFNGPSSTTGEQDIFTVVDPDGGGGSQDESSSFKVYRTGVFNANDDGSSVLELTYTGGSPQADKHFYALGRLADEGAVEWGIDLADSDIWTTGSIFGGATGTDCGGTGAACFNSPTIAFDATGGNSYINTGGNVGIGTTSPSTKLNINDPTSVSSPLHINASANNGHVLLTIPAGFPNWEIGVETDNDFYIARDGVENDFTIGDDGLIGIGSVNPLAKLEVKLSGGDSTSDALVVGKSSTEYLTILNGGNVGIGDTTPDALLDVAGNLIVEGAIQVSDGQNTSTLINRYGTYSFGHGVKINPGAELIVGGGESADTLDNSLLSGTSENLYLTADGQIEFWTSLQDYNATDQAVVIDTNQRVGIGDSSPDFALDVVGIIETSDGTDQGEVQFRADRQDCRIFEGANHILQMECATGIQLDADSNNNGNGAGIEFYDTGTQIASIDLSGNFQADGNLNIDGTGTNDILGDSNFDSNTLFVDASANSVGFLTNSPILNSTGTNIYLNADADNYGIVINKDFDSPDEPAALLITGDADGTDDIAIEVRGNSAGGSVHNPTWGTGVSSTDSAFVVFMNGNTVIGKANVGDSYAMTQGSMLEVSGLIYASGDLDAGGGDLLDDGANFFNGGCAANQYVSSISSDGTINCAADTGTGTMSSWTIAGDTGSEAVSDGQTVTIAGGTNGIDTLETGTRTIQLNIDWSEVSNQIDDAQIVDNGIDASSLAANSVADSELFDGGDWIITSNLNIGTNGQALVITPDGVLSDEDDALTINDALTVTGTITNNKVGSESVFSFPAVVNDPGFIIHREDSNQGRIFLIPSDDNTGNDYIAVTNTSYDRSIINGENIRLYTSGAANFEGTVTAGTFSGSGASLTSIPKGALSNSGTLSFDWADSEVADVLTISAGTILSNSVSGAWTTTGTLTIGDGGDRIDIASNTWDVTNGAISGVTTLDTGQGANELYDMDQDVLTSSSPTFAGATFTGRVAQSSSGFLIATKDNISTRTDSGYFQTSSANISEGWPEDATWYHLLATTHSNDANYFSMQFASDFFNSNDIFFRQTDDNGATAWNRLWHQGNDGSGSGLDADTVDGVQPGDITSVTAGSGLTGGGTSGDVTLNVGAGTGISVAADSISATLGTAIEKGELSNSGTLSFDWADSEVSDSLTISTNPLWDPDGNGGVFSYDDSNPILNGDGFGAVIDIRGDGAQDNSLVRPGAVHAQHFQSALGYYIGSPETNGTQIVDSSRNLLNIVGITASGGALDFSGASSVDFPASSIPGDDIQDNTIDSSEIQDDQLDFADFQDTLDLDATTEINLGASNLNIDLSSTGDFNILDAGATHHTFFDSGDVSLGNNNELYVDTSAGSVGIGTISPTVALDVNGSINAGDSYIFSDNSTQPYASTPNSRDWHVTTASYLQSKSISAEQINPRGLFFRQDGRKMYITGDTGDDIDEYTLSTPWDVSSASHVQTFSVTSQENNPQGVFFRQDGTKMYVVGIQFPGKVNEYTLSNPWNVSSASFIQSFTVSAQSFSPFDFFFRPDGTKMYVVDDNNDDVDEYTLSTPWSVSSASYTRSFSISAQENAPRGIFFRQDGTKMYVMGDTGDDVNEYTLSNPWNVSSASFLQTESISAGTTSPQSLSFKPDGTKMYVLGHVGLEVDEYDLGLIVAGGMVGINTTNPSDALTVVGNVNVSGCYELSNGTVIGGTCASDLNLKENISSLNVDLDKFLQLNPVSFEWKDKESFGEGVYKGFIAQEVEEIYPDRVSGENGTKKISYSWDWILDIIKVVQGQQKDIDNIEQENKALKEENEIIKQELCRKDTSYSWC